MNEAKQRLAEKIADALMTNARGEKATRIALRLRRRTEGECVERDLGGRCHKTVVDTIYEVLEKSLIMAEIRNE